MSDPEVEKVARAMCAASETWNYDDLPEGDMIRELFRKQARAAIEALNTQPSTGLVEALDFAQGEIAVAMAFLGRGPGPAKITVPPTPATAEAWAEMCRQIYERLAVADARARAALSQGEG